MFDATADQKSISRADSARLAEIFESYQPRIQRYIHNRLNRSDWHLAEDLTSETFVRAIRALHTVRADDEHLMGWLSTIARHTIAAHFRLRRAAEVVTDFADTDLRLATVPPAEDHALARLDARTMLRQHASGGVVGAAQPGRSITLRKMLLLEVAA
ncbi:RNA polymerase sigma factor [Streptomyces sp. NPDC057654]|uniref:RNA polymerase sigma factor n=1 Tax=Streptomyces sp. NPDC057654 TaxID=3346196 RepID=UPI0036973500